MIADPVNAVLVDWWLERGAKLDMWTDEEAERCRLAAFWPSIDDWRVHCRIERMEPTAEGERRWTWNFSVVGQGMANHIERFPHAFDLPDFALGVNVDDTVQRCMARGKRLPARFRRGMKRYAKVQPWPELLGRLTRGGYFPTSEVRP